MTARPIAPETLRDAIRSMYDSWMDRDGGDLYLAAHHDPKRRKIEQDILALVEARVRLSQAPSGLAAGWVAVPEAALKWLNGEGPDDQGSWFGDSREGLPGAFWWRTVFRRMRESAAPPAPSETEGAP